MSASKQEVVELVDKICAEGLARGSVHIIEHQGIRYFELRPLALRCLGCGVTVPQSRTRVSVEARHKWLLHHLACAHGD